MIDAALTSDAVAVAVIPKVGTTIVIVTQAVVASCPALSRLAGDTYVATVGNGTVVAREQSIEHDARWERARHYLERDPFAIAFHTDASDAVAVAQPAPIAAWITIDAVDLAPIERDVRAVVDRWRTTKLVPQIDRLVAKLDIKRNDHQLVIRATRLDADELVAMIGDLLRVAELPARAPTAVAFTCPPIAHGITACKDGTHYTVSSVAEIVRALASVQSTPTIENGEVIGVQLTADADALLRRGDVLLGVDSQRITNSSQLREVARHLADHTQLAVRRNGADVVIDLRE